MNPLPGLAVHMFGMLAGWAFVALVAASGWIRFSVFPPPMGMLNRCFLEGYPKQQDYFWFAAAVAGGWIGAAGSGWIWKRLRGRMAGAALRPGMLVAGWGGVITSMIGAFSSSGSVVVVAWVLLITGVGIIWLDGGWYRGRAAAIPDRGPEVGFHESIAALGVSAIVALAWVWDPCRSWIQLDPHHEGILLLWIQGALAGDVPGVDTRLTYGPLLTHGMLWWMKTFDLSVFGERGFLQFINVAGTALSLWAVWLVCSSAAARLAGVVLMLLGTFATCAGYGLANMPRTGLPLIALVAAWAGIRGSSLRLIAVAGGLIGISCLYSQEYGVSAALAAVVISLLSGGGWRTVRFVALGTMAGVLTGGLLLFLMFGSRWGEAAGAMILENFAAARLFGATALPVPAFPGWDGAAGLARLLGSRFFIERIALWGPSLLACAAAVRVAVEPAGSMRRPLVAGLAVFALLAQLPPIARPLIQIGTSAPAAFLLAVVLVDAWAGRVTRWIAAGVMIGYAVAVAGPSWGLPALRMRCLDQRPQPPNPVITRLGRVGLAREEMRVTRELVDLIRTHCPAGARLYLAAPYWLHLAFLADRPGLRPFACPALASTAEDRRLDTQALRDEAPPVALVTPGGTDLPFAIEHPEAWSILQRDYRVIRQVGDLQVLILKSPKTRLPAR